jgi:hypothetical protein
MIAQLNAVILNASNAGCGHYNNCGQGHRLTRGRGRAPLMYNVSGFPHGRGYPPQGGFPLTLPPGGGPLGFFSPGPPGRFYSGPTGGPLTYPAPPALHTGGGFTLPGGYRIPPAQAGANVQQQLYSNIVKRYVNWNTCYFCGFYVADSHTSMSCPPHLHKASHNINYNHQNAKQFIDLGHPCRHTTCLPPMSM